MYFIVACKSDSDLNGFPSTKTKSGGGARIVFYTTDLITPFSNDFFFILLLQTFSFFIAKLVKSTIIIESRDVKS